MTHDCLLSSKVLETRRDGGAIYRRRVCEHCEQKLVSVERVTNAALPRVERSRKSKGVDGLITNDGKHLAEVWR